MMHLQLYSLQCTLFTILLAGRVESFSAGPPAAQFFDQVCRRMTPNHGPDPQPGNGGYLIDTDLPRISSTSYSYTAGQTYRGQCRN